MINAHPDGVLNISANANDVSLLLSCTGAPSPTVAPPGLSSISVAPYDKAVSTLAGGGAATITGSNLRDVTRVKFGAATATITSKADTSISITVPASAAAGVSSSGGDVTVVASNSGGDSSALAFTYAPPVTVGNPNATYSASADATVSVDFSAAVFFGGYGPLTYSATGLPAGFSIDSGSGVISGRATYVPKTTIRVTATDQIGQSNASLIDFQTNPPRLQASARSIPPLYVGVAASEAGGVGFYPVEVTGGYSVPPGHVFSEPQGRLANLGLTLAADGKVTGAPTATFNGAITLAINDQANQSVTQDFTLVVNKAPQTVSITSTAPTPAVVSGTYQVVTTSVRANGGASTGLRPRISVSGGACTIDASNLVTFTAAGTCTVSASITNDPTYADASASAQVISVGKKTQAIVLTSTPPASARVNDTYQVNGYLMRDATRVDNADVTTATNTDVCTVNNGLVTMKAPGTCTITVSKTGDATYDAATPLTQTLPVVGKAAQDIVFTSAAPTGAKIGGTYAPTAVSRIAGTQTTTGRTPVISASGACSLTNGVVTFTSAGTCTVSATIANDATYADASASAQVLSVGKKTQTIVLTSSPPASARVNDAYQIAGYLMRDATRVDNADVTTATNTDVCIVNNGLVTMKALGTCTITVSKTGDATYDAATPITQSIPVVAKAAQDVVFTSTAPTGAKIGGTYAPTAVSRIAGTQTTTGLTPVIGASGACSVAGGTVTFTAAGTCTVSASITNDATYADASASAQVIAVGKKTQTIVLTSAPPASARVNDTYQVNGYLMRDATRVDNADVTTATNTDVCTVNNGLVTMKAPGTCTITVSKMGDATYDAATPLTQTIPVVGKAAQDIVFSSAAPTGAKIGGTYAPTAVSRIAGTQTTTGRTPVISASGACSLTNGVVTFTSAGTCTVSATIANDATYADASASAQVIAVGKKTQAIVLTSTPPASARVNDTYQVNGYLMRDATRVDNADVTTATITDVCIVNNGLVTMKAPGTCTITVSKTGDATYDAATPLTQTIPVVGKAAHMLASDAISAPSSAVAGGSYKPALKLSSAGLTPVLTSVAAAICRVEPDGTVRFLSAGKCTLTATAGNGDYADVSARLEITVAPANLPLATTVTLQASPTRPLVGQKMLLTANVTPPAATGMVTFRDGAAVIGSVMLSGGKASVATGAMSAGAHAITAAYSGDAIHAPATSVAATITPTAPPNPTADKSVRAIVATQSATAQRVVSRQLDTFQRRLEFLHDDNGAPFVNGLSISAPSGLPASASPFDDPVLKGQGFSRSEAGQALDRTLDKNFGKLAAMGQDWDAPARAKADGDRFSLLEGASFKVWTSGSLMFGGVTVSALGVETKTHFTLAGVTAGLDTTLTEGVKGGLAVSYSGQTDDLGAEGSKMDSRTLTGSLYASWRVADKVFLDGAVGYGDLFFSSKRLDGNGAGFIRGERRGKLLFGSLALSYDETLGPLKLSPYARIDASNASLNAYTETGAEDWTLSYDKATLPSRSLALGLRGQYDIEQPWGTLSPTWRAEYGRLLSGDLTQMVSYAAEASTRYAMTSAASDRDSLSAALGLKAKSKRDVTGALEYLLTGGMKSGVQGQGLRGMLRVGF